MINAFGLLVGLVAVVGGLVVLVQAQQRGWDAALSVWLLILAGLLISAAHVRGIRTGKGPDMRLLLAAALVFCAGALYNMYRFR